MQRTEAPRLPDAPPRQPRPSERRLAPAEDVRKDQTNGNGIHADDEIDLDVPRPRRVWVIIAAVLGILLLAALFITGLIPRHQQGKELAADAAEARNAPVLVNAIHPRPSPTVVEITVPGSLRPWQEVSIFARASGYLKKYYVDISNPVQAGQLIAVIETPETDQELLQARAALLQARAGVNKAIHDRELAKVTWERTSTLLQQKYVSQQEADEKKSAFEAAQSTLESTEANVKAAEANVQRLTDLQQFQKVTAPFSGVVTGRAYDVGSLILANPTATDVKPMFKIAENDILRAFVNVPQSSALQIKKGMTAKVTARERPGRVYTGLVMGTTNYLDPMSRSLLTEVKVPNPVEADGDFALLPGMFVQVEFNVKRDHPPLMIPGPALINNADGTRVALIKDNKVHLQTITLGQDFGSDLEVVEGLSPEDEVITNPGERIAEGTPVHTGTAENPAK